MKIVEPRHRMYLNISPGMVTRKAIRVEPRHRMYLNDREYFKIKE